MERMSEHTGLISSYQLLITAACTNTGSKMRGSHSRAADWCPFVPRHSLSQVTSFMQLGMLWQWWNMSVTPYQISAESTGFCVVVFSRLFNLHDNVIKWKHFPRYWPFVRGSHRSPLNSSHKGQWRGALMFSLIYALINGWVNNRGAGDLRRHRPHYWHALLALSEWKHRWQDVYHHKGLVYIHTCI